MDEKARRKKELRILVKKAKRQDKEIKAAEKSKRKDEKKKAKAERKLAKKLSEYKIFKSGLLEEEQAALDKYFLNFKMHCKMPKKETHLLREDTENAIIYLYKSGLSLDTVLKRLSCEKFGGFYSSPSSLWFSLDDAAKIYPFSMREGFMNIFGLSMNMTEPVVPEVLQMALNFTIKRFPSFATTLKKGVFWHYLDSTKRRFTVHKATDIPCSPIPISQSGSQSFRVLYHENRISIEFFHILTDGTGGVAFLRALVSEYLTLLGYESEPDETLINIADTPISEEIANEFAHVEKPKSASGFGDKGSLQMSGSHSSTLPCRVLHFKMDADTLYRKAKEYRTKVTPYLLSLMFLATAAATEEMQGDINIQLPVNMRKFYPTKTLRNFSMYTGIRMPMEKITSVEGMLPSITKQMEEKTSKEAMSAMIAGTDKLVNGIKLIPLVIKSPVAKTLYGFLGEKIFTTTLSNLGVVTMPKGFSEHIQDMEFTLGASKTNKASCTAITYGKTTTFTVTKNTVSPIFEEKFYSLLVSEGLAPTVEGSPLYEY